MSSDDFIDRIETRIYNKQWNSLLHDLAFHYDGINASAMRKILNSNKHGVVKGILKMIVEFTNEGQMDDLDHILRNLMPVLTSLRLDWPELDTINKSWQRDAGSRGNLAW
jgi:hypothetical protein